MIVIDVGAATYGGDESINALVNEFHPKELWGYDPASDPDQFMVQDTLVTVTQAAVWTYDGEIGFRVGGLGGQIHPKGLKVPCLDVHDVVDAAYVHGHEQGFVSGDTEVVLKLDCEGAEYELVPRLVETGADLLLKLALVEWHCEACQMGIWNQDMHRQGCPADKAAWVERRDRMRDSLQMIIVSPHAS